MSFALKRAAARRKRGHSHKLATRRTPSVAAAFGIGDDSENSDDAPQTQKVTTISVIVDVEPSAEAPPEQHLGEQVEHRVEKMGPKTSQIASMIERRKEAAIVSTIPREEKDNALFKYEVANCPDEADTYLYKQRPVDGFGEMMLRSMGWSGKERLQEKYEPPVARPNRLGLGAKISFLKNPERRKRAREKESKTGSAPDTCTEQEAPDEKGEGITVDRETARSDYKRIIRVKRLREEQHTHTHSN
ncbi:unnamed protein product [Agarophyton chilense]